MTAAELAAIAVLCISPALDDEPSKMTVIHKLPAICIEALKPAPPRVEAAAAPKKLVSGKHIVAPKPRKSRLAQLNPNVPAHILRQRHQCGNQTPDWYQKNSTWRYKCR